MWVRASASASTIMASGDVTLFDTVGIGLRTGNSGQHSSHGFPFRHGLWTVDVDGKYRVFGTWWDEQISECREDIGEALQAPRRSEALHHSLPFSSWNMRAFGTVVQSLMGSMLDLRHDPAFCRAV